MTIILIMFHPIVYILWYIAAFFSLVTAMSWMSLDALEISLKQIHEKWYKTKGVRSSSVMLFMALFFLYEGSGLASAHVSPASLLNNSVLATILAPLLCVVIFFFLAIVSTTVLHRELSR
jgi:hypothetical protein